MARARPRDSPRQRPRVPRLRTGPRPAALHRLPRELRARGPPPGGAEVATIRVPAITRFAWRELDPAAEWTELVDGVTWRPVGDSAVLTVRSLTNVRRPVDPNEPFCRVFREIRDAGIDDLVIDLRACRTGVAGSIEADAATEAAWVLASYLADAPFDVAGSGPGPGRATVLARDVSDWVDEGFAVQTNPLPSRPQGRSRPGTSKANATQRRVVPHPDRPRGDLTALIGPATSGPTVAMLARVAEQGRIRFVGEPSGTLVGSHDALAGTPVVRVTLPESGIRLTLPHGESEPTGGWGTTQALEPDLRVVPTLDDFQSGRDPVLAAALARD